LWTLMDIGDDKNRWGRTRVSDPVGTRAEFGEDLAGLKILCRAVVVMVGEDAAQKIDDGRVALMAVQTDMAAGRHDRLAEAQLAVGDRVDLRGEIDRGEDLLADRFIIRRRALLPQNKACRQESPAGAAQRNTMTTRLHLPPPLSGT